MPLSYSPGLGAQPERSQGASEARASWQCDKARRQNDQLQRRGHACLLVLAAWSVSKISRLSSDILHKLGRAAHVSIHSPARLRVKPSRNTPRLQSCRPAWGPRRELIKLGAISPQRPLAENLSEDLGGIKMLAARSTMQSMDTSLGRVLIGSSSQSIMSGHWAVDH